MIGGGVRRVEVQIKVKVEVEVGGKVLQMIYYLQSLMSEY